MHVFYAGCFTDRIKMNWILWRCVLFRSGRHSHSGWSQYLNIALCVNSYGPTYPHISQFPLYMEFGFFSFQQPGSSLSTLNLRTYTNIKLITKLNMELKQIPVILDFSPYRNVDFLIFWNQVPLLFIRVDHSYKLVHKIL